MNTRLELVAVNQPMVLTEKPMPKAPDNGYIVKVLYAGLCLTDTHLTHGTFSLDSLPIVIGHEISGEIYEAGQQAAKARPSVAVGQRVVIYFLAQCRTCVDCVADRSNCCRGGLTNCNMGSSVDGGFQQHVIVHDNLNVFPVGKGFPLDTGAIATCSGLTAWNAVSEIRQSVDSNLKIRGKATILIVGAGGLGYWTVEICKHLWPQDRVRICAVDVLDYKLEDVKRAGADIVFRWDRNAPDVEAANKLIEVMGGRVDAAVDLTGMTSSCHRIFHTLDTSSTWVIVGANNDVMPDISLNAIVQKSIHIKGVLTGTRCQLAELLELISTKKLCGPPIEHISLNKVNETLTKVGKGEQRGRAVVRFET